MSDPPVPNKAELFKQLKSNISWALREYQSGTQEGHLPFDPDWANHHFNLEAAAVSMMNLIGSRDCEQGLTALRDPNYFAGFYHQEGDPVAIGSLVTLIALETGEKEHYLLSPAGGGTVLRDNNFSCVVITPESPIGQAVMNKWVNYPFTVEGRSLRISQIH